MEVHAHSHTARKKWTHYFLIMALGVYLLLSFSQDMHAQNGDRDTAILLQKITAEKNDHRRIDLAIDFFSNTAEVDPVLGLKNAQLLLLRSQINKDKVTEALALSEIGYNYRALGNPAKSLEYSLKASALAQEYGDEKLMANTNINLGHNYKDQADYPKAIHTYLSVLASSYKLNDNLVLGWTFNSLAQVYMEMNKLDSALMYAQRAYEIVAKHDTLFLSPVLRHLGSIHGKMKNEGLAVSYFNMALAEAFKSNSKRFMNESYTALAQYYYNTTQEDSSVHYARKAIAIIKNTSFSTKTIIPAKLLLSIYENKNNDSAIKYFRLYKTANDSLFSVRSIQQTQLLTIEEDLRQQELAVKTAEVEQRRRQNIQYALIALGIILFIIFFFMLSRKVITNARVIQFLSVIALLIVFEFLNLLLHPFLEKITHHNPLLMLLGLVFIAALLVPLHHRLEKTAIHRLVEKNRQLRLAAAKKTIEKLEKNNA